MCTPEASACCTVIRESLAKGYEGSGRPLQLVLQEAIEAFSRLQTNQYSTGWVLCQVGRAHFEMVDYPAAARAFEWAREVDPHQIQVRLQREGGFWGGSAARSAHSCPEQLPV